MTKRLMLALMTLGILGTLFLIKAGFAGAPQEKKNPPPPQQQKPQPQQKAQPQQKPQPQQKGTAATKAAGPTTAAGGAAPANARAATGPTAPRALSGAESQQHIQELNRNRAGMTGINSRPLPQGQVTVHPDGRQTIATNDGRQIGVRPNGTVETMKLRDGTSATFRENGRLASIDAGGTHINRGLHGERQIVTDHGTYRLVSTGQNRGYLQRPYVVRNGQTYVQRTYVVNNVTYTSVYRTTVYNGVTYYRYAPVVYYRPVFYGWVYNPWPAPVYYTWGWNADPWYGYYGPYFAPYPAYPTASLWLTDFLLAENLKMAYEARAQAEAAQAQGENYPPAGANQNAAQMTPEVKQMIAEEVKQQLAAQQAAAQQPAAVSPPQTTNVPSAQAPDALNPAERTFVVSKNMAVNATDGQQCGLTPGDALMRLTDTPDANQNVNASVQASVPADCSSGKTVAVGVQDLQDMQNHFREQIDGGLKTLASNSGKGGLPQAPDTTTTPGEVPPPAPDANVQVLLAAQQKSADQLEAQFE